MAHLTRVVVVSLILRQYCSTKPTDDKTILYISLSIDAKLALTIAISPIAMSFDPKALLQDLPPLANDPHAFSAARKEILQQHFAALDASRRAPIRELQCEIEIACAIAGSPVRAVSAILVMLEQRLEVITRLEQAGREICGDEKE